MTTSPSNRLPARPVLLNQVAGPLFGALAAAHPIGLGGGTLVTRPARDFSRALAPHVELRAGPE